MQYADRVIVRVVKAACAARGIDVELALDGWLMVLRKGDVRRFIHGYDFGLNSSVAHRLANDKAATADMLDAAGVGCVPHRLFMNHDHFKHVASGGHWSALLELLHASPTGVVLKPNEGTCGHLVFKATTELALERAATAIFAAGQNLAVAPFLEIEREVRVILLESEPMVVYEKKRPALVGDGARTVVELLLATVPADRLAATLTNLPPNRVGIDQVLPEGELFVLDWRHNLDLGARPELIGEGPLRDRCVALAVQAAEAIGLRFGAVDVVLSNAGARVLEINSGVMIEALDRWHPQIADRVYTQALDRLLHDIAD